jgi:cellobiose epimerase
MTVASEGGLADAEWRDRLAGELLSDLHEHVTRPWFPAAIDEQAGGFHVRLDRRWRRKPGPQHRTLESQARQTRTVARLGLALPADERWRQHTRHGLAFLREVMRDDRLGGWYLAVDEAGAPLADGSKHGHGTAYLIDAGIEAYRLLGEPGALAMAVEAFEWMEAHLHDPRHGGYFGWADRSGRPVRGDADVRPAMGSEPLGNSVGLKDANTSSDMLEALALLAKTLPDDDRVRGRLAEMYDVCARRLVDDDGRVTYAALPDWTRADSSERFGYGFQIGYRLVAAASVLGGDEQETLLAAQRLFERSDRHGRHPAGGYRFASRVGLAGDVARRLARRREWWVLTEAVRSLVMLVDRCPDRPEYRSRLGELLEVAGRDFIDHRCGGWYATPPRDRAIWKRLLRPRDDKADEWKDASHEADMYLDCIRTLRNLGPTAPVE